MIPAWIVNRLVYKNPEKYHDLHIDLIGIRSGLTLEQYLNRAILGGIGTGIFFGLIGIIVGFALFSLDFGLKPELYNVLNLSYDPGTGGLPIVIFVQVLLGIILFLVGSLIGFWGFTLYPSIAKKSRETKITIGLPNAVSYMYAMRKGGAEIITILRSLSEMAAIYGEVSLEFRLAVRDADFFGYDIINLSSAFHSPTAQVKT